MRFVWNKEEEITNILMTTLDISTTIRWRFGLNTRKQLSRFILITLLRFDSRLGQTGENRGEFDFVSLSATAPCLSKSIWNSTLYVRKCAVCFPELKEWINNNRSSTELVSRARRNQSKLNDLNVHTTTSLFVLCQAGNIFKCFHAVYSKSEDITPLI